MVGSLGEWYAFCLHYVGKKWNPNIRRMIMAFINTLKNKLLSFNRKAEDYQSAITFSQAGLTTDGETRTSSIRCSENEGANIVVASRDSRFSEDIIDYALEMASRMDYGIIAVNAANLTHDLTDFFSTTHDRLCKDFEEASKSSVVDFQDRAEKQGIKFAHCIQFATIDDAVKEITKECGQIEFIISENREQPSLRDVPANESRIAQRLCVYAME